MKKPILGPIAALMCYLDASLHLVSIMPQTDVCLDLKELLLDQIDILFRMHVGHDFDEEEILDHCDSCSEIIEEIRLIKESRFPNS